MYASNMLSSNGNPVPNQVVVTIDLLNTTYFQSYDTIVAKIERDGNYMKTTIDVSWDNPKLAGSKTTRKNLSRFLMEPTQTMIDKIHNGVYRIENLNEKG